MAGIADWLPAFDVAQRHHVDLTVSPEQALRLALGAPAAPDALVRLLMRVRGLRTAGSIQEFMAANGFTTLEHTPTTFVVGLRAGRRRLPLPDARAWRETAPPGSVSIAAEFRAEARPGGSRLVTETRVAASDRRALRAFRLYWLIVAPFSKFIRRRWLRAIARRQQTVLTAS